jgi:predicted permease
MNEHELVTIQLGSREAPAFVSWAVSHPDYLTLRERLPLGGALAARTPIDVDVRAGEGAAQRIEGEMVTANYFSVIGSRVAEGRGFNTEEDDGSGPPVVVLSYELARQLSGEGASIVGQEIVINGRVVPVVGVMAPGFRGVDLPGRARVWLPLAARTVIDPAADEPLASRMAEVWRRMVGRLPAGTSVGQVAMAADAAVEAVRTEFAGSGHSYLATHQRLQVTEGVGLDQSVRGDVETTLSQLGGAALLLLLLSIANLANLTLMESTRRQAATAVRMALGASRTAIARRMLVEASLLGAMSAAAAVTLAAMWAGWYQDTRLSERGGALSGMGVDLTIIGFAALTAWLAATVVWLRPAFTASRFASETLIRRGAGDTRSGHLLRSGLVAAQVALSLILLVSAGLLSRTVSNLRAIELGFDPDLLLTFPVDPHRHGYESGRLALLAQDLESEMRASGIGAAGFISPSPLHSSYVTAALYGSTDPEARPLIGAGYFVSEGFLDALGIRMVAGPEPWHADSGTAVLSRSAISAIFPGMPPQAAIGRLVPTRREGRGLMRIAGVIDDLRLSDITRDPPPVILRPIAERHAGMTVTGFARGPRPATLVPIVHRVMARRAPELPAHDLQTARALVDRQFAERHAMATAALTLSALGLLLAVVGLYGVLAAMVAARRREIGVRSALGAAPSAIMRRVLGTGLAPVVAGAAIGSSGAVAAGRLLSAHLYGIPPFDSRSFLQAAGVLVSAGLIAAFIPAYRATQVSPVEVLRED